MSAPTVQGNARDLITLRDYIDMKVHANRELTDIRLKLMDDALKLQAAENARRLMDLNHEQARLAADRERFLPRETYALGMEDFQKWRTDVNNAIAAGSGRSQGIATAGAAVLAVVMAAIALGGVLMGLVRH